MLLGTESHHPEMHGGAAAQSDEGSLPACGASPLLDCAVFPFILKGTWCSGITSALYAEGPGFKSQCVHFKLQFLLSVHKVIVSESMACLVIVHTCQGLVMSMHFEGMKCALGL